MIYVVMRNSGYINGIEPIGYFHTREEAQKMADYHNCYNITNDDIDDEYSDATYEVCGINELTGREDYDKAKYQYAFDVFVKRELYPPHKIYTSIHSGVKQVRDHLYMHAEYREDVIVFRVVLFENDEQQLKWIVEKIAKDEFKIDCAPGKDNLGGVTALNVNEKMLKRYIAMYKKQLRDSKEAAS